MKFTSREDTLFFVIIYGMIAYIMYVAFKFLDTAQPQDVWVYILMFLVVVFMLSLLHFTKYKLTKENLSYRCGPFFGSIKVNDIKEIVVGKTLWVGMRPAKARKGLIVKYKKGFGEIYISPKTNESFVEELLKLNPEIKITK